MLELVRNKARRNLLLLLKSRQPGNVPTRQTLKMNVKCQPCPSDRITRLGAPLAAVASRMDLVECICYGDGGFGEGRGRFASIPQIQLVGLAGGSGG